MFNSLGASSPQSPVAEFKILPPPAQISPSPAELDRAYQFLCHCLRCFLQDSSLDLAQTPWATDPPWPLMLQLAKHQGCTNLVYQLLDGEPSGTVPEAAKISLRQAAQQQLATSMKLIQSLAQLLRLLEEHGIRAIAYKGPMLAQIVYGNIGLRSFTDLDIWVAPEDFARTRQLLIDKAGYEIADRTWTFLSPAAEEAFFQEEGECALVNGIVHVDLHCRLAPAYFLGDRLRFEDVWQRTVPVSCLGLQVHTLSPEDRLIYLCIHGSKEHWRSLKWIMDLAMSLKASQSSTGN